VNNAIKRRIFLAAHSDTSLDKRPVHSAKVRFPIEINFSCGYRMRSSGHWEVGRIPASRADPVSLHVDSSYPSFAVLLIYLPKLPQPGNSEVTFAVFESSCHLLLPV